jgi:hypothetical protein
MLDLGILNVDQINCCNLLLLIDNFANYFNGVNFQQ